MQKLTITVLALLALTVMGEIAMQNTLVRNNMITVAYRVEADAGISSSYWSVLQRAPGDPLIPEATNRATNNIKETYGASIYSFVSATLYFEFFKGYELAYTFNFIPVNIVPYAQYFMVLRPWLSLTGGATSRGF